MQIANPKPMLKRGKDAQGKQTKTPIVTQDQPGLQLPHEHDESHGSQSGGPHKVMRQAKRDIDAGVVDTDRRSSYGMGDDKGLGERSKK